ncbi:hypothetical protein AOLI_G00073230 [Acnodon oligacanthus]
MRAESTRSGTRELNPRQECNRDALPRVNMHAAESELRALDSALRVCARWRRAGGDGQALQPSSRRAPDPASLHALETDASALQMRAPGERRATLPAERYGEESSARTHMEEHGLRFLAHVKWICSLCLCAPG